MKKFVILLTLFIGVSPLSFAADFFGSHHLKDIDTDFFEQLKTCTKYSINIETKYVLEHPQKKGLQCLETEQFFREIVPEEKYCMVKFGGGSHMHSAKELKPGEDDYCAADGYAPGGCKFPKKILKDINKDNIDKYYAKYCYEI